MPIYATIFGIDVSKNTLDIFAITPSGRHFLQIANTAKGITAWLETISDQNTLCTLEATGCYSSRLVHYLERYGIAFNIVNPGQSHAFMTAQGIISKNDRQAAQSLALMGQCLDLPLYRPINNDMKKRKQVLMGINALKKQKQMLRNQLHALNHQILYAPKVKQALEQTLETVKQQIQLLEEQLQDLGDEEYQQQFDLLLSIKGIGPKTAHLLLSATGGLQNFDHARKLSKFIGLVPSSHTSGTSVYFKGKITKRGNADLRATLYMAARTAKQYNLACKELYERLRKTGKPHKKAVVAVMNKLVKQAFGVVQSGVAFNNQHYLKFKTN